jgi:hypothetical protein
MKSAVSVKTALDLSLDEICTAEEDIHRWVALVNKDGSC